MDYLKHYKLLVESRRYRGLDKTQIGRYLEFHHIVPRCMGGSDDSDNLVMLTGQEHFIAHHLLAKIYKGNRKIQRAFAAMSRSKRKRRLTARQVNRARRAFSAGFVNRSIHLWEHVKTKERKEATTKEMERDCGGTAKCYGEAINQKRLNTAYGWRHIKVIYEDKDAIKKDKPKPSNRNNSIHLFMHEEHGLKISTCFDMGDNPKERNFFGSLVRKNRRQVNGWRFIRTLYVD